MNKYIHGVELECIVNGNAFNIANEILPPFNGIGINVGEDSSIKSEKSGYYGIELRTKPLNLKNVSTDLADIQNLSQKLQLEVNPTCGMHIHTSTPKFHNQVNLRKIFALWVAIEDVMFSTQPESRLNSPYCSRRLASYAAQGFPSLPEDKQNLVDEVGSSNRYFALNFRSLNDHGTIECRLHAGTLNAEKIINWIRLLRAFFEYATENYETKKVKALFEMPIEKEKINKTWELLKLKKDLRDFYNARIEKFIFPRLVEQQKKAKQLTQFRLQSRKEEIKVTKEIKKLLDKERKLRKTLDSKMQVFTEKKYKLNDTFTKIRTVKLNLLQELVGENFTGDLTDFLTAWANTNPSDIFLGTARKSKIIPLLTTTDLELLLENQ